MEKKQIIILLIIAGIYIFNAIRKMKAKADANNNPNNSPSSDDEYEYEYEEEFEPVQMDQIPAKEFNIDVKKYQFIAESLESDSLESESLETTTNTFSTTKSPIFDSQISDNEKDNTFVISTQAEDIRKGIIYSEILQKKYN
jgi:hypothetical protein